MSETKSGQLVTVKWAELLYFLSFGLMFAAKGVGLDEGQKLFEICAAVSLVCLAGKLCLTRHSLKEWMVMALLVGLGAAIWKSSGENAALAAMLVIIGMKRVPIRRLFAVCLGIWSCTFALSVTLGILHIRDGVVVVHQKLGLGPIIRWSLGYTHPNVLHVSYFILAALLLYAFDWHGKELRKACAVLFLGNLLIFLFSISYTGVLLMAGYLALSLYLDWRKSLSRPERILLQCVLPLCVLFPLAGPFVAKGRVYDFFNKLLSTRFDLVKNYFTSFPVSLFGTPAYFTNTTAHLTLDSSFAYLLMFYGVAAFLLFVAGYWILIRKFIREEQKKELAMMIGIVVAAVTEQFLFNLSYKNLSFFFLGALLFDLLRPGKGRERAWWNREFSVLPWEDRELSLPDPAAVWRRKAKPYRRFGRPFLGALLGAGIAAAAIRGITVQLPDSVYFNRGLTEYRKEEDEVFLDLEQVPEDFNSLVIGYEGPDTGMYCFSGNIVTMEWIRNVAGYGFLGMEAALILGAAAVLLIPQGRGSGREHV